MRRSLVLALVPALAFAGCAAGPDLASLRWRECRSPTNASLRGLAPLGAEVAFVAGEGGLLLRTLDGGASWTPVGPRGAGTLDFRSLAAAADGRVALANAGSPAAIFASGDGGGTWTQAHADARPEAFFDSLAIDRAGRGFVLGDPVGGRFALLRSDDGGLHWADASAALPAALPGEAAFAASNGCIALPAPGQVCLVTGGASARALVSFDDGASWRACELPLLHGQASQGAFAVAFADPLRGVVVGGDYQKPAVGDGTAAWTEDGGRTWQAAAVPPAGYRSGVAALAGAGGAFLAVGPFGASLTRDGGRTWQPFGELGFHTVRVAEDGSIWAAGSGGRIARLRE